MLRTVKEFLDTEVQVTPDVENKSSEAESDDSSMSLLFGGDSLVDFLKDF